MKRVIVCFILQAFNCYCEIDSSMMTVIIEKSRNENLNWNNYNNHIIWIKHATDKHIIENIMWQNLFLY